MELKVNNPDNLPLKDFCEELIVKIKRETLAKLNFQKLGLRDDYINSDKVLKFVGSKRYISSVSVINLALNNMVVKDGGSFLTISINENMKLYGTENKLIDIIKLIEYGNQELQPYMLIRDTIDSLDIAQLYNKYKEGKAL